MKDDSNESKAKFDAFSLIPGRCQSFTEVQKNESTYHIK